MARSRWSPAAANSPACARTSDRLTCASARPGSSSRALSNSWRAAFTSTKRLKTMPNSLCAFAELGFSRTASASCSIASPLIPCRANVFPSNTRASIVFGSAAIVWRSVVSAFSKEPMETSSLALSRLDCPDANSSEQASTTISPTTITRALIIGRIIGSRISGHLLETLWNASGLAIVSNPIFRIPPGKASCPIPENNFFRDLSFVHVVYTSGHVAMRLPRVNSGDCDDRASYAELLMLDDERVMRHLQAGNTDAFAVIFKRYHRLVHVTALHILRDAAEAEDLTQSVFLEIYRKADNSTLREGLLKCGFSNTRIAAAPIGGTIYWSGSCTTR